jgi:hypothetical protein
VIKIRGGGDVERSVLSQVDAKSLDAMSQTTAQNYDKWLRSVATNPAVMDFRLTGIWEVCGAKRKTVEDAFREFGKMMRPLLRIETHCGPNPGPGYTPGVFLDGTLVPFERSGPAEGWGGYRLVVIDRKQPNAGGVRLSKVYTQTSGAGDKYREIFDRMLGDLRGGSFLQDGYFVVLSTFGMYNAFPPTPDMTRALQETGAGGQLGAWLGLAARGVGTANITHDISYMLVGITKSGPDAGVEVLAAFPMPPSGRIGHTSKLDVYFYSLGPRRPYVLGPAERRAMTA